MEKLTLNLSLPQKATNQLLEQKINEIIEKIERKENEKNEEKPIEENQ